MDSPKPESVTALRNRFSLTALECANLIHHSENDWLAYENGKKIMHPAFWELLRLKTGHSLPTDFDINEHAKVSITTPDGRSWEKLKRRDKWLDKGANAWPDKYRGIGDHGPMDCTLYLYERGRSGAYSKRERWAYPWGQLAVGDLAVFLVNSQTEEDTINRSVRNRSDDGFGYRILRGTVSGKNAIIVKRCY